MAPMFPLRNSEPLITKWLACTWSNAQMKLHVQNFTHILFYWLHTTQKNGQPCPWEIYELSGLNRRTLVTNRQLFLDRVELFLRCISSSFIFPFVDQSKSFYNLFLPRHHSSAHMDGTFYFPWRNYADKHKQKTMTLHVNEFIGRFLLHILPHR